MIRTEEYIDFDSFAQDYDFTRAISYEMLNIFLSNFLEVVKPIGVINNILEIGCGTGRIARIFAINNYDITGVDISKKMLEKALEKAQSEHWRFKGVVADARSLPFKNGEFSIVYTVHVLHLIKDWKSVLNEALRCSSNGFLDIKLERSIFKTDVMINYWKYLQDLGLGQKFLTDKKIGAQNPEDIKNYMETKGYSRIEKEFHHKSTISRSLLIEIVNTKSFSSQRFIPDEVHKQVIQYLQNNDYFIPEDKNEIEIDENGLISYYFLES